MARIVQLSISEEPEGSWRLSLAASRQKSSQGVLSSEAVAEARTRLSSLLRPPSLVSRKTLPNLERKEQEAGGLLVELIERAGLKREWASLTAGSEPICLAIDTDGLAARSIPWELVALKPGGAALEEATQGLVLRLDDGRPVGAHGVAESLRVWTWCPTPKDAACAAVLAQLSLAHPLPDVLPSEEEGVAELLILVCHGTQVEEGLLLGLKEVDGGTGTVVGLLSRILPRVRAALILVCEAGAPTSMHLEDLALRLLGAGASAVVSASCPLLPKAAAAFAKDFIEAANRGDDLVGTMSCGRRAVRALLEPHPDSRPYSFQLRVSDLRVLEQGPWVQRRWRPEGWPRVGGELAGLLSRMAKAARLEGHLWVGLEHLWMSIQTDEGGALSRRVARALGALPRDLQRMLFVGAERGGCAELGLMASPRLRAIGSKLLEGSDLDALWRVLAQDEGHGLHLFLQQPLSLLVDWDPDGSRPSLDLSRSIHPPEGPAHRLEILWGPEDGRRIDLGVGQVLGRWHRSGAADVALFAETSGQDALLSRRALIWSGPGRAEVLRARRWEGKPGTEMKGQLELRVGEVWMLSDGTWIRCLE